MYGFLGSRKPIKFLIISLSNIRFFFSSLYLGFVISQRVRTGLISVSCISHLIYLLIWILLNLYRICFSPVIYLVFYGSSASYLAPKCVKLVIFSKLWFPTRMLILQRLFLRYQKLPSYYYYYYYYFIYLYTDS